MVRRTVWDHHERNAAVIRVDIRQPARPSIDRHGFHLPPVPGFDAYGLPPSAFVYVGDGPLGADAVAGIVQRRGDDRDPEFPGETAMIPPPTPPLAGRPLW